MLNLSIKQLDRNDLRSQAVNVLRASIISGDLVPGTVYSAAALAVKMGVSITPVREAILDMANAGLIEVIRNRGFRVTSVADDDIREITEVRLMLEPPAMRLISERASDSELESLRPLVDAIKAHSGVDFVAVFAIDRQFHLELLRLSRNDRLLKMITMLRDQRRLRGIQPSLHKRAIMDSALEHEKILDALLARQADTAVDLMYRHIACTRGIWAGHPEDYQEESTSV